MQNDNLKDENTPSHDSKNSNMRAGQQSIAFTKKVFIRSAASIVGTKEGEGPLGKEFDMIANDDMFGCSTWEDAESTLQKDAVYLALKKSGLKKEQIRYLFAGDLLGQSIASSFGLMSYQIPLFGLYGACSTCGESLSLAAAFVAAGYAEHVIAVTSSHFASAEKEFRFPLDYGSQRPKCATWTVTGGGAFVVTAEEVAEKERTEKVVEKEVVTDKVSAEKSVVISGITTGRIVDFGLKDAFNMGCCMAPAACDTIFHNFRDFNRTPDDYDLIVTGDLGSVGSQALYDLLREKGFDISKKHTDCGMMIYNDVKQSTDSGGSGCGCAATVLASFLLKKIREGELNRILFVPTGALLSKVSLNEGKSVPGIAHGIVIENM